MHINFKHTLRHMALAMTLAALSAMSSASTIKVAIDTSTFGAASGYLDMQFSASGGVVLQTATVDKLVGFDSAGFIDSWGVTLVDGGFVFRNDTPNDLYHAVNFGGLLSFDLTFSGADDPLSAYVSHFWLAAFDEDSAPLGTLNPTTGTLADFSWTPALNAGVGGAIGASISDPSVTFIPEPSGLPLAGIGLAAVALVLRRRCLSSAQAD